MNSFCVSFLTILTIFSGNVLSKITQDRFEQLFNARASFPRILAEIFDNDPSIQLQHLHTVQKHIDANDAYATYATHLKTAAQKIVESTLRDIGYEGDDVTLEEFMEASNKVASGEHLDNENLEEVIQMLLQHKQEISEAPEHEKNAELTKIASKAGDDANEGSGQHEVPEEKETPVRHTAPVSAQSYVENDSDN